MRESSSPGLEARDADTSSRITVTMVSILNQREKKYFLERSFLLARLFGQSSTQLFDSFHQLVVPYTCSC
jgi:hypothetical protein